MAVAEAKRAARFWLAAAGILAASMALHLRTVLNDDVSWFLWSARALLHGAQPGVDFLDTNSPLAAVLYLPAAWLAERGLGYPLALILWLHIAVAGIAAAARAAAPGQDGFVLVGLALMTLGVGRDFGQRDMLVGFGCWPLVLAAAARVEGRPPAAVTAFAVALLAAAACCVKPFYVVLPLLLELWAAWRMRRWRALAAPANLAAAALGAALAAGVVLWAPAYAQALPMLAAAYAIPSHLLLTLAVAGLYGAVLLAVAVLPWRRSPRPAVATAHLLAGLASLGAFLVQVKDLPYQVIPTTFFLLLAMETTLRTRDAASRPRAVVAARGALLVVAMAVIYWSPDEVGQDTDHWPLPAFLREHAGGRPVFVFSPTMGLTYPAVVYAEVEWAGRFGYPMLSVAALAARRGAPGGLWRQPAPGELDAEAQRVMREDFETRRPGLVLVEHKQDTRQASLRGDDLLAFHLQDPAFRAIWTTYRPIPGIPGYDAYRCGGAP